MSDYDRFSDVFVKGDTQTESKNPSFWIKVSQVLKFCYINILFLVLRFYLSAWILLIFLTNYLISIYKEFLHVISYSLRKKIENKVTASINPLWRVGVLLLHIYQILINLSKKIPDVPNLSQTCLQFKFFSITLTSNPSVKIEDKNVKFQNFKLLQFYHKAFFGKFESLELLACYFFIISEGLAKKSSFFAKI